ncbi:MAG: DUF1643 domain-containing protein [Clostridiales bacterium]|nr:DUF1643 domain-containing protein [Clostridia bacterium]MCR4883923.1 DUF1643 domain-containing protein [Clostridiales bacterium]
MRHIPTGDLPGLDVDFETYLQRAMEPHEAYDVRKWLFVPDAYTEFRYILGTRGSHPLICIGINPSTARPDDLDRTLQSVERIALNNGFDSFTMFNVYAQRATSPDDMAEEMNLRLHEENMKAFDYCLSLSPAPTVWAAWGSIIEKRAYLKHCLEDMIRHGQEKGAVWVKCGQVSKKGHPHHPLYLKSTLPLEPFDVTDYVQHVL